MIPNFNHNENRSSTSANNLETALNMLHRQHAQLEVHNVRTNATLHERSMSSWRHSLKLQPFPAHFQPRPPQVSCAAQTTSSPDRKWQKSQQTVLQSVKAAPPKVMASTKCHRACRQLDLEVQQRCVPLPASALGGSIYRKYHKYIANINISVWVSYRQFRYRFFRYIDILSVTKWNIGIFSLFYHKGPTFSDFLTLI